MIMVSFRTKEDKEHLLKKAKKMEEYAAMIVECLEESEYDEYDERSYRHDYDEDDEMSGRYGYRKMARRMR